MILRALLGATLLLAAAGCQAEPDQPIRIGLAGPFSDPVGGPMHLAAELAVEEINAAGGVNGRPLALLALDDGGDPDSAVAVAETLSGSAAVAVVGHVYSSTTLSAAPVYGAARIPVPVITPSSSAPGLTQSGPHLFRLCPTDLEHGAALASWTRHGLGLRRGAILYLNDAYGRGVRQAFAARFQALGGELVGIYPYLGSVPEVGPYLDRLAADDSLEFLVVAGNREEAEVVLREARSRELQVPVLGGDGLEGIEAAGPLAEGVYLTAAYHPSVGTSQNERFVAAFREKYPEAELPNQPAAATYDAIYLLRDVMLQSAPTRRAILRTLPQIGLDLPPFQGVTGTFTFDEHGDPIRHPILIGVVRAGAVDIAVRR